MCARNLPWSTIFAIEIQNLDLPQPVTMIADDLRQPNVDERDVQVFPLRHPIAPARPIGHNGVDEAAVWRGVW